jgi:hypothetical protein
VSGFDRIGRPGATRNGRLNGRDGRWAVFSGAPDGPPGVDRWLECTVDCTRCSRRRGVGPARLLLACVPFAFVAPWRTHPLLARCPSCARIAWLALRYPADEPIGPG